jgi:hypothetical protein
MSAPPRGWADLLAENMASVELETDAGTIARSMRLERGSVKMTDTGVVTGFNVLSLDPDRFFNETGPKRAQTVAEASQYDGFEWKGMVPAHLLASTKTYKHWTPWVAHELDEWKLRLSELAAAKKMYAQTLRGLETLRGLVIEDDTQKKVKLDQMKEKLGQLKQTVKAVEDQIEKARKPRVQSTTQKQLDGILRQLQDYVGWMHDAETIEQRASTNEKAIKARVARGIVKTDMLAKATQERSQESLTINTLEAQIAQAQMTLKAIKAKYDRLRTAKCCPVCGTAGKSFKAAIDKIETDESTPATEQLRASREAMAKHKKQYDVIDAELEKAQAILNEQQELEDERQKLIVERRLIGLWSMHEALVKQLQAETIPLDLAGLEERKYEIECDVEDLADSITIVENEVQQIAYNRAEKRKMEDVEKSLSAVEEQWVATNTQVQELDQLRARFTAMSLMPILKTLETFTAGIFSEPVALEGTELGRMIGAKWVPLTQFSGSEQAVAMAALTCALRVGKAENIVIVDEMGSFDDEHLALFMKNVQAAVSEKVLTQFVGLTTPRKSVVKGVTIIRI